MQQKKSKNYSLADKPKKQSESQRCFKVKSTLVFYWVLLFLGGAASIYLACAGKEKLPADVLWTYLPRFIWMVTLAIIFFDSLNISFLHSTPLYEGIAKEAQNKGLMPNIIQMCFLTGGLLLIGILLTLHNSNYSQTGLICCLGTIALGWFITGILQFFRFR